VVRVRTRHHLLGDLLGATANGGFQPVANFGIILEVLLGVFTPLTDADAVVGEPAARLLDHSCLDAEIEDFADLRDAFAVHDIELDLLERRRDLVLHHLHARGVANAPRAALRLPGPGHARG